MKIKSLLSVSASLFFSMAAVAATSPIPDHMNGVWIYDSVYDGTTQLPPQAGLFVSAVNSYNQSAGIGHQMNELFPYGGDMEMYCKESGCTSKDLDFYFFPEPNANSKTPKEIGDSGFRSTYVYKTGVTTPAHTIISPVIDGRTDTGYLKQFNSLSPELAAAYADKVSMAVCADDNVDGIQFDIEPFDISAQGQKAFYTEIAKDFAGHYSDSSVDSLHCVDKAHPNGRFFSVFTFANEINRTLADIFNQYGNGYVVDSLYDLSTEPGGTVSSPKQYADKLAQEVSLLKDNADQFGVKYQVAIPASASAHEFESVDGKPTGYQQLTYVTEALNAVASSDLRSDPNFVGVDVWTFDQKMLWHGMEFEPSSPNAETLQYLQTYL